MRQEHGPDAFRAVIVAEGFAVNEFIYGPYARASSARMMRTREVKYLKEHDFTIISADIEQATGWAKVEN